jgi:heme-degrading monooxygenase HmoA
MVRWGSERDALARRLADEFAHTRSLPMFERHDGIRGVRFATAGDERVVITLWRDRDLARPARDD